MRRAFFALSSLLIRYGISADREKRVQRRRLANGLAPCRHVSLFVCHAYATIAAPFFFVADRTARADLSPPHRSVLARQSARVTKRAFARSPTGLILSFQFPRGFLPVFFESRKRQVRNDESLRRTTCFDEIRLGNWKDGALVVQGNGVLLVDGYTSLRRTVPKQKRQRKNERERRRRACAYSCFLFQDEQTRMQKKSLNERCLRTVWSFSVISIYSVSLCLYPCDAHSDRKGTERSLWRLKHRSVTRSLRSFFRFVSFPFLSSPFLSFPLLSFPSPPFSSLPYPTTNPPLAFPCSPIRFVSFRFACSFIRAPRNHLANKEKRHWR